MGGGMSYADFLRKKQAFCAEKIVIGSKNAYAEIKKSILDSGAFMENDILYIDDWAQRFPKRVDLFEVSPLSPRPPVVNMIPQKLLSNAKLYAERTLPVYDIPKGGVIAEIGVALGEFSEKLLKIIQPRFFYAVDMFSDKTKGFWGGRQFEESGMTHEQYYRNKFKGLESKMALHRGMSWEAIKEIPDDSLDYAYIDAGHDYASVRNDIDAIYPKMKQGAIMQFNDYTLHENFGIIPAVNDFVIKTNSEVLFFAFSYNEHNDIGIRVGK